MLDLTGSQLRSTKQLLGRAGERFLLFGMLGHSKEGKLCLEDHEGSVQLDFSQLVSYARPVNEAVADRVEPRTNPARVCSQRERLHWLKAIILTSLPLWSSPSGILPVRTVKLPGMLSSSGPRTTLITYRSVYGHIDFLGKGATTPQEDVRSSPYGVSRSH